ncbi:MAG: hypothetical protein DRI61_17710, partial [Chloroflexi bacterium]
MNNPKVSVIIPTFNSASFIKRTLASVLAQTYGDFEIIISDDGSADNTREIVEDYLRKNSSTPWKVIKNPHRGPGAARNAGIKAASGEWIAFLDSDDLWLPQKLEKVMNYAQYNKKAQLISHSELWLYPDGKTKVANYYKMYKENVDPFLNFWRKNLLATSAVTVKKNVFSLSGLFDENLYNNQDYDLWLRIVQHVRPYYLNEVLDIYYVRKKGISQNHLRRLKYRLLIGRKYIDIIKQKARYPNLEIRGFFLRAYLSVAKSLLLSRNTTKDGL